MSGVGGNAEAIYYAGQPFMVMLGSEFAISNTAHPHLADVLTVTRSGVDIGHRFRGGKALIAGAVFAYRSDLPQE